MSRLEVEEFGRDSGREFYRKLLSNFRQIESGIAGLAKDLQPVLSLLDGILEFDHRSQETYVAAVHNGRVLSGTLAKWPTIYARGDHLSSVSGEPLVRPSEPPRFLLPRVRLLRYVCREGMFWCQGPKEYEVWLDIEFVCPFHVSLEAEEGEVCLKLTKPRSFIVDVLSDEAAVQWVCQGLAFVDWELLDKERRLLWPNGTS